jgi:DNA-binding protein YbaB
MNIPNDDSQEVIKGLMAANSFLKETITTVENSGVVVTVSGEPRLIDVKIEKHLPSDELAKILKESVNKALEINRNKVLENALTAMPNS